MTRHSGVRVGLNLTVSFRRSAGLRVCLGYRDVEDAASNIARADRVRRFTTNLDLVTRLWAGEEVDADLPWCRLAGARLSVLPVQRPRSPVWLAANSDNAVRRAARLGDAWMINPHATV